jgi:hypothetical protein
MGGVKHVIIENGSSMVAELAGVILWRGNELSTDKNPISRPSSLDFNAPNLRLSASIKGGSCGDW